MRRECLWCDTPTGSSDPLCPECRAVHDGPVYHCDVHPLPTLGTSCAECDSLAARRALATAQSEPIVFQLRRIREQLIAEWSSRWEGCEHGKGFVGHAIDCAIADLTGAPTPPPLRPPPKPRKSRRCEQSTTPPKLNRRAVEARAERLFIGVDPGGL